LAKRPDLLGSEDNLAWEQTHFCMEEKGSMLGKEARRA